MQDDIFKSFNGSFKFDDKVANVFDDMLSRSIPFYKETLRLSASFLLKYAQNNALIYDLGSSTGEFANVLCNMNKEQNNFKLNIKAIDNSKHMIKKSKRKLSQLDCDVDFIQADIIDYKLDSGCSGVVMNYTLQFIPIQNREMVLKKIFNCLKSGGVLIFSEKVLPNARCLSQNYTNEYYTLKEHNGYSGEEIINKHKALQDVLNPLSYEQNHSLLIKAGFRDIDCLFKWVNFATFIAIKY